MKTIVFNGSPRHDGDTVRLISAFTDVLGGEVTRVDSYYRGISPCIDCRYCKTHASCSIRDGFDEVIENLDAADNVVIASPVHFSELSGSLLGLMSRFQLLYTAKLRGEVLIRSKPRSGVILHAAGGDGSPERAAKTARILLRQLGAEPVGEVICNDTDRLPAKDNSAVLDETRRLAERIRLPFTSHT